MVKEAASLPRGVFWDSDYNRTLSLFHAQTIGRVLDLCSGNSCYHIVSIHLLATQKAAEDKTYYK